MDVIVISVKHRETTVIWSILFAEEPGVFLFFVLKLLDNLEAQNSWGLGFLYVGLTGFMIQTSQMYQIQCYKFLVLYSF